MEYAKYVSTAEHAEHRGAPRSTAEHRGARGVRGEPERAAECVEHCDSAEYEGVHGVPWSVAECPEVS